MAQPKAVIFDMDGLIIDSEPLWRIAEIKGFAAFGMPITEEECELTIGWRIDEVVAYWKKRRPWKSGTEPEVVQSILDCLLEEIAANGKALPGILELLAYLQKENIRIALASSSPLFVIEAVIEQLQISDYFEIVKSAEHEDYGKPHPGIFIHTAQALGVGFEDCLVLEDSINGVIAAKAAKMKCVAIPATHQLDRKEFGIADAIFASAEQLIPYLSKA